MWAISTRFSVNSVENRLKPIAYKSWQSMQKMSKRLRRFVSAFLLFILRSLYLDFSNQQLRFNGDFCELVPVDFLLIYVK